MRPCRALRSYVVAGVCHRARSGPPVGRRPVFRQAAVGLRCRRSRPARRALRPAVRAAGGGRSRAPRLPPRRGCGWRRSSAPGRRGSRRSNHDLCLAHAARRVLPASRARGIPTVRSITIMNAPSERGPAGPPVPPGVVPPTSASWRNPRRSAPPSPHGRDRLGRRDKPVLRQSARRRPAGRGRCPRMDQVSGHLCRPVLCLVRRRARSYRLTSMARPTNPPSGAACGPRRTARTRSTRSTWSGPASTGLDPDHGNRRADRRVQTDRNNVPAPRGLPQPPAVPLGPERIADTSDQALEHLFALAGSQYTDPQFSWKHVLAPARHRLPGRQRARGTLARRTPSPRTRPEGRGTTARGGHS
jgi:hypothetical protein